MFHSHLNVAEFFFSLSGNIWLFLIYYRYPSIETIADELPRFFMKLTPSKPPRHKTPNTLSYNHWVGITHRKQSLFNAEDLPLIIFRCWDLTSQNSTTELSPVADQPLLISGVKSPQGFAKLSWLCIPLTRPVLAKPISMTSGDSQSHSLPKPKPQHQTPKMPSLQPLSQ
jgi:hypothetical protein